MRASVCRPCLFLLMLCLSACGRFEGWGNLGDIPEGTIRQEEDNAFDSSYYRGMFEVRNNRQGGYDTQFAGSLERRIKRIAGVDDARVIVFSDAILIGVQTARDDDRIFGRIRHNLRSEAANYQIYMTNRPDLLARITSIHEQIRDGKRNPELNREIQRLISDLAAFSPPLRY